MVDMLLKTLATKFRKLVTVELSIFLSYNRFFLDETYVLMVNCVVQVNVAYLYHEIMVYTYRWSIGQTPNVHSATSGSKLTQ